MIKKKKRNRVFVQFPLGRSETSSRRSLSLSCRRFGEVHVFKCWCIRPYCWPLCVHSNCTVRSLNQTQAQRARSTNSCSTLLLTGKLVLGWSHVSTRRWRSILTWVVQLQRLGSPDNCSLSFLFSVTVAAHSVFTTFAAHITNESVLLFIAVV